jgi:Reverse transcriptase (RNA-dependent DNA polymerase)
MASILLDRIKGAVDVQPRQQQAGFRTGRSCCDQIFALRQVIGKVTALNALLLVNFINFRKAFDCIHRMSVWFNLRCYGLPEKVFKVIQSVYKDSRCTVRADGEGGDWFQIITGVRQSCVFSPLIFFLVMNWIILKQTLNWSSASRRKRGRPRMNWTTTVKKTWKASL